MQIAPFAPVEYLTYGSRDSRRVFRLPRRSARYASASRFADVEYVIALTKLLGKFQEGGISPLLGRFKGDCKGGESKLSLAVFFLPPAAFSLPRKEKGAETPPTSSGCGPAAPAARLSCALRAQKMPPLSGDKARALWARPCACGTDRVSPLWGDKMPPYGGIKTAALAGGRFYQISNTPSVTMPMTTSAIIA